MNILANVVVMLLANSLLQVVSIDLAQEIFSLVETVMEDTDGYLPSNPHEICCGAVGCFDNSEPHDDPLLPLPGCPESLLIYMAFYSRNNPTDAQVITRTIIPTNFDGSKLTIFLVHGWMGGRITNFFTAWEYVYKDLFLNIGDYNGIAVTWDIGADNPYYLQSVSNTRSVGAEISLVRQHLIGNAALDRSQLYCIGHSLGAHVCGHAGERLKFGRITGLDPAGPWYDMHSSTAGLNPNCADFVDVIHTDATWDAAHGISFGNMRTLGHVDFYVNNGGIQPGCVLFGCSHERAIEYFQESISSPCFLVRQECADQTDMPASCVNSTNAIQSMGWISNTYEAKGIFHVQTRSTRPFCLH